MKIHEIYFINPRPFLLMFYNNKEKMFTIEKEDGREMTWKPSFLYYTFMYSLFFHIYIYILYFLCITYFFNFLFFSTRANYIFLILFLFYIWYYTFMYSLFFSYFIFLDYTFYVFLIFPYLYFNIILSMNSFSYFLISIFILYSSCIPIPIWYIPIACINWVVFGRINSSRQGSGEIKYSGSIIFNYLNLYSYLTFRSLIK